MFYFNGFSENCNKLFFRLFLEAVEDMVVTIFGLDFLLSLLLEFFHLGLCKQMLLLLCLLELLDFRLLYAGKLLLVFKLGQRNLK